MPQSAEPLRRALLRPELRRPGVAVGCGLVSGAAAAGAYYSDTFRPAAHVLFPWVALALVVSARRRRRDAATCSAAALVAAVLAFYLGKAALYRRLYAGSTSLLDAEQIAVWAVFALAAGGVLGVWFSAIGDGRWTGDAATASAVGVVLADVGRRLAGHPDEAPVVLLLAAVALAAVLVVSVRAGVRPQFVLAWTPLAVVVGLLLVSAPDLVEQWLAEHGR